MTRLRDDPTFWQSVRWWMDGIFWPGVFMVMALVAFMIWMVVRGW